MKRNPISNAVQKALFTGFIASSAYGTVALAQDGDDSVEEQGKITVTGSRIRATDLEGAKPVTVITREDIELSGMQTAADILRTTTFNSFGSFRERSGSAGGQAALVDLRGLGASRTAVLINGRRLPGTALFGSSAANLNTVPIAAIERVEILTGGASAIYGADAIAGVINIILRSDYEGAEISLGMARPNDDGGDEENGSFVVGANSDKANIVFAAEFFRRNPVFDRDRDYSGVQINGPGFADTVGVSGYGNTGLALDYSSAFAVGECQSTDEGGLYAGVLTDPFGISGTGCGFGYADVSAMTGDINRFNTFLNASYEINDNHSLYFQNSLARVQSFGRYAPAAGGFLITADAPLNTTGEAFILGHRFVGHGPRDENFVDFTVDSVLGVQGVIFDDRVNYSAYWRSYNSNINNIGTGYINRSAIIDAVSSGEYNFVNPLDPTNAQAIINTQSTNTRDLRTRYNEAQVSFDGLAFELPAGSIGWAAGAEWAEINYRDRYDANREAGNVIGSAGNSSFGDRERVSVFGELAIPLFDSLELQLAGRYDDYDDFGSNFSPSVSLRWQALDNLVVRASYTEGFKAPNLTSLNGSRSESFNNVTDQLQCDAAGTAPEDCPTFQVRNFAGGNPGLQAEESEGFDIGVVWEPIDNLTLGIDYFETDLFDAIQQIGLGVLLQLERDGIALPAGTAIIRSAPSFPGDPGRIQRIETGQANIAEFNVTGVDAKIGYRFVTDRMGSFSAQLSYSKLLDYIFTSLPAPLGVPADLLNQRGAPDSRANFSANWTYGDHTLSLVSYWINSTENNAGNEDPAVPSFTNHNLSYIYRASWNADITVGVRNLADRQPSIDSLTGFTGNFEPQLYDVFGRTPFINYTQRF